MQNLMLIGLLSAAPTTDDGQYLLNHSEVGLELGTFSRNQSAVFTPLVHARFRVLESLAFELDLPFAILDGGNEGTSVIGNVAVSGRYLAKLENVGFFEAGLGFSFPTGFISEDNPGPDGNAQAIAGAMLGLQPPYRYGESILAVFIPVRLELASEQRAYVLLDGQMAILGSTSEDGGSIVAPLDFGGAVALLVRGGYRPGPFDLSIGMGATALFGQSFAVSGENDVEAQTFVEPGLAFRVGPEDQLSGLELGSRLRILLDPPLGGGGLADGFYSFFFDLTYRFDVLN